MSEITNKIHISFPVLSVLGCVFVTLKLCHVIAWSWWWVVLPFYAPALLILTIGALVLIGALTIGALGFIAKMFARG